MLSEFFLSFRKEVCLIQPPENSQIILQLKQFSDRKLTFKNATPGLKIALETLANSPATISQLQKIVWEKDGFEAQQKFDYYFKKITRLGWICYSVLTDGEKIATATPLTSDYKFLNLNLSPDKKYTLSRFAALHQTKGKITLQSSYSPAQITLDWRGTALVALLNTPQDIGQISAQMPTIAPEVITQFLNLLLGNQILAEVQPDGQVIETFIEDKNNNFKWLIPPHSIAIPTDKEKLIWDEFHKDYEGSIINVTPDANLCETLINPSRKTPNFDIPNSPDIKILIPGCGSEIYLQQKFLELCPQIGQIFCTDFSPQAIELAKENWQKFTENIENQNINIPAEQFNFLEADSTKLTEQKPDWKNQFDYVIVVNSVLSDDDIKNRLMIREFYQVLKPGGKLYGLFPTIFCDLEIAYLIPDKAYLITEGIVNINDNANYYQKTRNNRQIFYTTLRLNRIFQESGFKRINWEIFFGDSDFSATNYREKMQIDDPDIYQWEFLVRLEKI